MWNSIGVIKSAIKSWRPRNCSKEKDFEKSLYIFLHKKFPDIQVTKQYAKGRIRADILVGDKIIIELKNEVLLRFSWMDNRV